MQEVDLAAVVVVIVLNADAQVRSPRTNMELLLTILLAIASVILAVNGLLTMCSRNYAGWRSSWRRVHRRRRGYYTEFRETVPLILSGHKQVFHSLLSFLADRTNGRTYATVLRLSSVVRL